MDRRHFITAIATAVCLGSASSAYTECGEMSITEFVETTWQKQARLHNEKTPPGDEEFYALFSSEMQQSMRAPRSIPANAPVGPLLNAFFGWGVLPGTEIEIGRLARVFGQEEGPATIRVSIKHRGERRNILVHVIRESGYWRLANVIYDSGKSLISHYRGIARG